jgi:hypothetical protein
MTGVTAVVAGSGGNSLYRIGIDSGSSVGNTAASASGTVRTGNFSVSTNGPDATTTFDYSISRISGSAKITAAKIADATTGLTPTYRWSFSDLAVGESVTAEFRVRASKAGYEDGINRFTVDVTRTS